jgi:hypothetical protein
MTKGTCHIPILPLPPTVPTTATAQQTQSRKEVIRCSEAIRKAHVVWGWAEAQTLVTACALLRICVSMQLRVGPQRWALARDLEAGGKVHM